MWIFVTFLLATLPLYGAITARNSDAVSYSRARLNFTTDTTSTNDQYCVSSVSVTPPFTQCVMLNTAGATLNHSKIVGRLTPNTIYHWYVCTNNGAVCTDGSDTFTTGPEPSPRFKLPTKPTMVTPLIDSGSYTGGTYTMSACTQAEFQAGLNTAAAYAGTGSYLILVPWASNEVCNGINGRLPSRACEPNCGTIVVRPAVPSELYLPPPGVRLHPDQAFWWSNAPTLSSNTINAGNCNTTCPSALYANTTTSNWLFIGLKFTRSNATNDPGSSIINIHDDTKVLGIHDITFDRYAILQPGTVPPSSTSLRGITASMNNLCMINGYVYIVENSSTWLAIAFEITGLQGGRFENNDVMAPGISIFAQGRSTQTDATRTMNIYLHRNHHWWDRAWAIDGAGSLYTRQMLEFKQAWYVWVDGDIFEAQWAGGQTGNFSDNITLTLRASDNPGDINGSTNQMTQLLFTNITARNTPGFLVSSGEEGSASTPRNIDGFGSSDWWFENILIYGINGYDCHRVSACAERGQVALFGGAIENLTFDHVTSIAPQQGFAGPYNFAWLDNRGSGLRIRNNILSANWDGSVSYGLGGSFYANASTTAYPALPAATLPNTAARWNYFLTNEDGVDPSLDISHNLAFVGSIDSKTPSTYTNPAFLYDVATCAALYQQMGPTNTCVGVGTTPNDTLYSQASTFMLNAAAQNYTWMYNSPYVGAASDGTTLGVDLYKLSVAQGLVIGSSLQANASRDVYWETRDPNTVCYIDQGVTRTTVAGGSRFKHVTLASGGAFTLSCANAMDDVTYKPAVYQSAVPTH